MGISDLIKRTAKQTAVYWGDPTNDGYGGYTFDSPVEILCRWEDSDQVLDEINTQGEKHVSRAKVYTTQDIAIDSMLYLGSLSDLTSEQQSNPTTVPNIYIVKRVERVPSLGSDSDFLYRIYLSPWLNL